MRRSLGSSPASAAGRRVRERLHTVVMAGGVGERFWPRSRQRRPKQFLELAGGRSLLAATLARARRYTRPDQIWVICGRAHARAVRAATGLPPARVLAEPVGRNTAAAAAYASMRIAAERDDALVALLPADHVIPDARAFAAALRRAARAAAEAGVLVTLGVKPTRPDTAYGYIERGRPAPGHAGLHVVRRFKEKPDLASARRFLRSGRFLWNAGIFVWSAQAFLDELARCAPQLALALEPLRARPTGRGARAALERAYAAAPALPVDIAVIERSDRVWTLPVSFHWSDVGTWRSLAEELGARGDANAVLAGEALFEDAGANLVWGAPGRLVALLGVRGLAVIDAGDALLVADLERSADVRRVVAQLRRNGRLDLLQ